MNLKHLFFIELVYNWKVAIVEQYINTRKGSEL